jgi:hypothetical protein
MINDLCHQRPQVTEYRFNSASTVNTTQPTAGVTGIFHL